MQDQKIPSSDSPKDLFIIGLVISMFSWGLSWTSGKILSEYAAPMNISLFRFALTFLSLLMLLLIIRQPLSIAKKGIGTLIIASLLMTLYSFLFFKGLSIGKAGAGGVLVTTFNPIVSYLIALLITKRLPGRNELIGLSIGIVACIILLRAWVKWDVILNPGNSYFISASIVWAILSLFTAKSSSFGSPVSFSLWLFGISALLMLFITNPSDNLTLLQHSDKVFWINMVFSATITTALATTFYFVATSTLGASKASSFIFLVPVSAALGSWIFLKEVPEKHTIAGGLLGIIAVYMLNKK
ncbi:MAG: DMT family transporter [Cytophagales bacterium]|nr:DMT family transporter [Cytophaga sp.]